MTIAVTSKKLDANTFGFGVYPNQSKELINEIKSTPHIPGVEQNQPLITINGGTNPGTLQNQYMNMNTLPVMQSLTMTSREIAELTKKRHDNVLRDIDDALKLLSSELRLGFKSSTYVDSTGKSNRQYEMDRDSTYCLITGYDVNSRMRIIKRWQELEAKSAAPVPNSFAEALKLAYEQQLKIEQLEVKVATDKPKVEFFDTVTSENPKLSIGDYAKLLSEANDIVIGPNKLFDFLRSAGYLMEGRDIKEKNKPYQRYVEMGYFIVEYIPTNVGMKVQPLITSFGQVELANQIIAHFSKTP